MLCPEVWNFKAPQHLIEYHDQGAQTKDADSDKKFKDIINSHYFNHSVSVVLPNTSSIPESFNENILEDTDYYRVDGLRIVELISKEFIESFVKKESSIC